MVDLKKLIPTISKDKKIQDEFMAIKAKNKEKLWHLVKNATGVELNLNSLFDI